MNTVVRHFAKMLMENVNAVVLDCLFHLYDSVVVIIVLLPPGVFLYLSLV